MKKVGIFINWVLILVCCAVAGLSASDSSAAITPVAPFQAEALPDPNPPAFIYSSSIAYYNNYLIYAGDDGQIYGYNLDSGDSVIIADTRSLKSGFTAVQGFLVSSDDYLYFHDNYLFPNGLQSIYRLQLSGGWPVAYETLVTDATSAIFTFTENPWTNAIWFSSSDFGSGNFYLYEIDSGFTKATLRSSFAKKGDNSGNGPIIFEDETTLLYGESVFGENGYFHQVDTATGAVIQADYLTFTGGLADATYGDNNRIYVTSGGGKTIFELQGSAEPLAIGTTDNDAQGIVYGDDNFYISELILSGADTGKTSLDKFWDASPTPVPPTSSSGGGGGGGCFIENADPGTLSQNYAFSYLLFPVVLWLGIGIIMRLRRE